MEHKINIDIDKKFTAWSERYKAYYHHEPNSYYSFRAGFLSERVTDACMPSERALKTVEGQKPPTNSRMDEHWKRQQAASVGRNARFENRYLKGGAHEHE